MSSTGSDGLTSSNVLFIAQSLNKSLTPHFSFNTARWALIRARRRPRMVINVYIAEKLENIKFVTFDFRQLKYRLRTSFQGVQSVANSSWKGCSQHT